MRSVVSTLIVLVLSILVSACGSWGDKRKSNSGKYYQDDGPPINSVFTPKKDATPKLERLSKYGNSAYVVKGRKYVPDVHIKDWVEHGQASWYGKKYHGRTTSSGEVYDMYAMTAAHKTLPLPSYVRVVNLKNNISVVVKVNDRGPFLKDRIIDLSYAAARKMGLDKMGVAPVKLELLLPPVN